MKTFRVLLRREMSAYFLSPATYLIPVFFLAVMGFGFWLTVAELARGRYGGPQIDGLFTSVFFWVALLGVTPPITMRLIAEERRNGTLETLLTAPVKDTEVALAKFAGAWLYFAALWLPTLSYAYILQTFSSGRAPLDWGAIGSAYFGALLIGAFFISVGLFLSTLNRSQLVSAVCCFGVTGLLLLAGFLPYLEVNSPIVSVSEYVSPIGHMRDFAAGVIDTRPIVFYLSGAVLMLFATVKALESRYWR